MTKHNPSLGALVLRMLDYLSLERSFALAVLSPDLIVLDATENFRDFQGDPSVFSTGKHISELVWELVGSESGLKEVLEGKAEIFSLDNINRDMGNEESLYFSLKAIPHDEEKTGDGLLLILENTTYASMLEQQLVQDRNELRLAKDVLSNANDELSKLNRLKSLFLSIAAHDLRSPLTAMRGYAELARKSLLPDIKPDVAEYLSIIQSLVDTQSRLISDFLDLDIIEQGKLKMRFEPCNLNVLVADVVQVMNTVARRKNVVIQTKFNGAPPSIHADPDRIRQILFNLLGNAVKYTNEGDHVEVETKNDENAVQFIVSDHGQGVPEADIPYLFDIYHRTEEAKQSKTKGLGLGLFIVKSLVDLHHGQITVASQLGKGTTFAVSIPIRDHNGGGG